MKKLILTFVLVLCLVGTLTAQMPPDRLPMPREESIDSIVAIKVLITRADSSIDSLMAHIDFANGNITFTARDSASFSSLLSARLGMNVLGDLNVDGDLIVTEKATVVDTLILGASGDSVVVLIILADDGTNKGLRLRQRGDASYGFDFLLDGWVDGKLTLHEVNSGTPTLFWGWDRTGDSTYTPKLFSARAGLNVEGIGAFYGDSTFVSNYFTVITAGSGAGHISSRIRNTSSNPATLNFKTGHSANSDWTIGASIAVGNAFEIRNVADSKSYFALDHDGNLSLGGNTVAADDLLHIYGGSAGAVAAAANARLVVEDDGAAVINILSPSSTTNSGLWFGDEANSGVGQFNYNHTLPGWEFFVEAEKTVDITADGMTVIGTSNTDTVDVTVDMKAAEGFSFPIDDYDTWNRYPITGTSTDTSKWTGNDGAVINNDPTNHLTDGWAIKFTDDGQYGGAVIVATNWELGDTSLTEAQDGTEIDTLNWYFCMSVYGDSTSIARLNGYIRIAFNKDVAVGGGDLMHYDYDVTSFVAGWNQVHLLMSDFTDYAGGFGWGDLGNFYFAMLTAPDGEISLTLENLYLGRKGAGAYPNVFQSPRGAGGWRQDWNNTSGNITIVNESGQLGAMVLNGSSYMDYYKTLTEDFEASGITRAGVTGDHTICYAYSGNKRLNAYAGTQFKMYDSTGTAVYGAIPFNYSSYDDIHWKFSRKGKTAITGALSLTGIDGDWVTIHTTCISAGLLPRIYGAERIRWYELGASTVSFAAESGLAYRLKGLGIKIGAKDSLWIQKADSTYHILATPYYNPGGH